jgi:uncharacterized protein (DUF1697 family)
MAPRPRHVLLLRGVNVGGKNRLPMTALVALMEDAGAGDVRTYVQSGNAVFEASVGKAGGIARAVEDGLARRLGLTIPVVLRSASELAKVVSANPFLRAGGDEKELHVVFLAQAPSRAKAARLDHERSPGDSFVLRGKDLYLRLPNGVARTKLTNAYLDKTLGTVSTARNWRTVLALHALVTLDG